MYPGYFQTAYVTNDLEQAMQQLGSAYGINNWYTDRNFETPILPEKTVTFRVALAYIGDTQIEIIDPVAGAFAHYKTVLTDDKSFQLKLHHMCQAFDTVEEYDAKVTELKRTGVPIPAEITREMNSSFGLACYGDFRSMCGHYLEYIWLNEAARAWMGTVPRN